MEWISINNALPICMNWVLVTCIRNGTGELAPVNFARYDDVDKTWDFFETNEFEWIGPTCSDGCGEMDLGEISHWLPIPRSPRKDE